jgi:tRNA A-37 threonylcarbamoyl transferase component Bud32/Tfp pilus assembly protein PilF
MTGVPERLAAALSDRYRIERELGAGGMATVYLAHDVKHDRKVALKVLRPELAAALGQGRFLREITTTANLRHPHILPLYDSGLVSLPPLRDAESREGDEALFYVMPLVEGESLRERLDREKQLPLDDALQIAGEVADALSYAHSRGVIHRDIKPENILLESGHAVVADFGIARALDSASGTRLTETGLAIGTPTYMSPEQAVGEPLDARSDLYSLGAVLYEMLAGEPPYTGPSAQAVFAKRMMAPVPRVTTLRESVPRAVEQALLRALAKSPADRFDTAGGFALALDPSVAAQAAPASRGRPRWQQWAVGMTIAAVLVGLAATTYRARSGARATPVSAEDGRNVIAVLPFTVRGAPELSYLAEGLVDIVSGKLDGAGPLRAIDPRAVVGRIGDRRPETLDAASSAQVATALGAGRFITGQLVGLPGHVSLSARLHASDDPAAEQPLVTVEGSADSLYVLVDRLAAGLLANSLSGANARIQRSAAQSSRSLLATKEFLRGEQFHRRGQFDSASASYNRALAEDSTFALAHVMKSMNNAYTYDTDDYLAAVNAARFSTNLPERDRGIVLAFLDQQSGRLSSAEQRWIAHLQRYPDEVKALLQLGMLYNRANPRWGRPIEQSRPYFERVLALEPENVPALHHLARLDAAARFADSLRVRAQVLERVAPDTEWAVDVWTMSIFTDGDSAQMRRFIESYPDQTLLVRIYAAYNAMRFSSDPRDVDRLLARQRAAGRATATGLPDAVAIDADFSRLLDVLSHLAAGRYDDIRAFLTDPARRRTPTWDVYDGELVALGLVPVDSALLASVLQRVRDVDPEERLRTKFEPLHDIFTPAVAALERDVTMAKLLAMQGRFDEAWAIQRRLAALPPFTAWESLRDDAAGGLAAELHYLAGDRGRALDVLRSLRFQVPQTANSLAITSGSHARYRRAELEIELGDPEVARQYYEGLVASFTPSDKLFLATAYERLGRIHEAAGRVDQAIYWYGRFVRSWADADAPLIPTRRAAEQRLETLRARAGQVGADSPGRSSRGTAEDAP